ASLAAATMRRDLLGPTGEPGAAPPARLLSELASVVGELAAGMRYVVRRRGPASVLAAIGASKFLFGILFVMSILLYRDYFYPSSGPAAEGHYVGLATASGIGYACAALVVPPATRRLTKPAVITLLLAASAVITGALGETFDQIAYLAIGFCLYLAGQGVAICAVTILQEEVDDACRGRLFAFYDVMFNVTLAAGALTSAAFIPHTGKSSALIGVVAVGYALTAAVYWLVGGRPSALEEPGTSSPSSSAAQAKS